MTKFAIAVVDDDPHYLGLLVNAVESAGARAVPCVSAIEWSAVASRVDAVITDYRVPHQADGEAIVVACRARTPALPVAVLTALDHAASAVRLLRLGATDYLIKPPSVADLDLAVRSFAERLESQRPGERASTSARGAAKTASHTILATSPGLAPLLSELNRIGRSGANVLVLGESGAGKELAARAVHELSRRATGPFVGVDCGAIPEPLIENELFGHKRGAFSDAREDRAGLVEEADGGTLFLDEVGELPIHVQSKLLRFLQTREYRRLGDASVRIANVRVIAATHRDLESAMLEGRFRRDLFYRLNVIRVLVPPLRERRSDIEGLATGFLRRYAAEFDMPGWSLSLEAVGLLRDHPWNGNVRELENVVQRVAAHAQSAIVDRDDGEPYLDHPSAKTDRDGPIDLALPYHAAKRRVLDTFERSYAQNLLKTHGGRIGAAAEAAGIDRKSLSRLLDRLGVKVEDLL